MKTDKKEPAPEVSVQEQASITINQLRIKNGLEPIKDGDLRLISIEQLDN